MKEKENSKEKSPKFSLLPDIWGGLAAAAMLLPQAMAFGVALLAPLGISPGVGALAGLIGAASLSLASGVAGGTRGLISSPTGPMLILLGSALGLVATDTGNPANVLTALTALVVVTGIIQVFIGASGGGKLIKFIPYSVVVGFMTGTAILMILSQIAPLSAKGADASWASWIWLPFVTALVTFAITFYLPRLTKIIPATLAGLIGGTLFFHAIAAFASGSIPQAWVIGSLPSLNSIKPGVDISIVWSLNWGIIIVASLAAAILASLDTLLTSVIADVSTGTRHNARKELIGQGIGHLMSGFSGGMAGAGTTGATVVAIGSGGRRWVGVVTSFALIVIVGIGGGLGTLLPIAVLAGIIIRVSVGMLERDIITWITNRESRADAIIALLVTGVTVFYDLMVAVGLGVLIAVILYLRKQIKAPVIHRRYKGSEHHSVKQRTKEQREQLNQNGDCIVVCELRGDLFFATADQLFEELLPDLDHASWLILNLRRVIRVDLTGAKILQQLAERLHSTDGELIFCEVHKGVGLGHDVGKTLKRLSPDSKDIGIKTFIGTDEALEYAENALLISENIGQPILITRVEMESMDICSNLDTSLVANLKQRLDIRSFKKEEVIFERGDLGSELFFVLQGEVDIRLNTTEHHYKRLAKYPPGTVFGEIAFLDPGPRSADAVAVSDCELAVLSQDDFKFLAEGQPKAAIALLIGLSRLQSEELRWSTQEIQRLGDW
jgi:SulP family sulfate permease